MVGTSNQSVPEMAIDSWVSLESGHPVVAIWIGMLRIHQRIEGLSGGSCDHCDPSISNNWEPQNC